MSLEPAFELKHTNVSRPRLSHSDSQQSIAASQAASEGYYSLSDNNTSSESERHQRNRYHTPPSQYRTPTASHEQLQQHPEVPIASLRGIGIQRAHPQDHLHPQVVSPTVSTIVEERPDTALSSQHRGMDGESIVTTPGMDTTPYIRFAIDQLTRDEDVRGSRLYPQAAIAEEEDYPVERLVSDDGLSYMAQEQQTQQRLSQNRAQNPSQHIPTYSTTPTLHSFSHPKSQTYESANQKRTPVAEPVQEDKFVVFRPTIDSHPHTPLHFVPRILRPVSLALFFLLCLAVIAVLIFSVIHPSHANRIGLWNYIAFGDSRYFIFSYLPTLVGVMVLMWLIQIEVALQRVVPFIALASGTDAQRTGAAFLQLHSMQFLVPKLEYFRAGQPLIGTLSLVFWLFTWTIPLLASAYNVRYDLDAGVWHWVAVQGVVWTIVVLYVLLVLILPILMFYLRKETGLRWDPRSLADIIAMLERSNTMSDYHDSETFQKHEWNRVRGRANRLGYWTTSKRPNDVFYGIGEEGRAPRRYSVEQGRIRETGAERVPTNDRPNCEFSIRMDLRSPKVRLSYLPWYLRDTSAIACVVTAVVLYVAFLVVSFVNSAVKLGFLPQVYARTNAGGWSASNFLYSFIPATIGLFLFLVMLTLDYSIRNLRPYISLSSKGGATAETSLLVDYSSRLPLSVTLAALDNRHYQNVVLSLSSLFSIAIPVIAGGVFWTQYHSDNNLVRVSADQPAFYALCVFLGLYVLGVCAILPGRRKAALPHRSNTLAEIISWVYQSPILTDRAFARPETKPKLVTSLMGPAYLERSFTSSVIALVKGSRDNLEAEPSKEGAIKTEKRSKESHRGANGDLRNSTLEPGKIRYGFGIHVGRDGLEHLGIDRVRRGGDRSGRELVIWEEQRRRSWAADV